MELKPVSEKTLSKYQVPVDKLRKKCGVEELGFTTTKELPEWSGTLDQKEALDAIDFGLAIRKRGFNIFAVGRAGSGKTSTILKLIRKRAKNEPVAKDICYIHNFDEPYEPLGLFLQAGKGRLFATHMENMVRELRLETPKILTTPAMNRLRSEMTTQARAALNESLQELMDEAARKGIHIKVTEEGDLIPATLVKGELFTEEELHNITEMSPEVLKIQKELNKASLELLELTLDFDRKQHALERDFQAIIDKEEKKRLAPLIDRMLKEVKAELGTRDEILDAYFTRIKTHYMENYGDFVAQEGNAAPDIDLPPEALELLQAAMSDPDEVPLEFKVNVLVDRSKSESAPVYVESNPTYSNLMGYLEYDEHHGALSTNHAQIRPGALHRANGGYLLLQANDILSNPASWFGLKKALRHREIRVEELRDEGRPRITGTVKPAPLPLDVKVVVVGSDELFYLLHNNDEDFTRLFKVKADFSTYMDRNINNLKSLSSFLGQIVSEEGHLDLHARAVAAIIEHANRIMGDQDLVTNRTSTFLDLVAEADFWARQRAKKPRFIDVVDVERAIEERRNRHARIEQIARREIKVQTLLIDTKGSVVGQINGMAVYDLGDYAFGIPARITAITYAGDKGIVNIDREVNLSGNIHDKGSMILVGYLGGRFATERPMNFNASITFEQNYSMVEGDSASSTEIYALLSSLSKVPISQSIAVTGSVNQQGVIQAIGGVNEKIEGFYEVCKMNGLTGKEGVIIPFANVRNLMLSKEVIEAVSSGKFAVYAVKNIDEGMEILTGFRAGARKKDGTWPDGTLNALINNRIKELSDLAESSDD
ncbi:AAA family ATPase [Myxococcota bacterium]|nr:AAA family ATPase [Myxococcota bacterium]